MINWHRWDRFDALIQSTIFALLWACMITIQLMLFIKLSVAPSEVLNEVKVLKAENEQRYTVIQEELSAIRQFINEHVGRAQARETMQEKGL